MARRPEHIHSRGYILVNLRTGSIENGDSINDPIQLASFTKMWTAATLLSMGARFRTDEMRRYLSRSDNDLGVVLAAEAMGMRREAQTARRYLDSRATSNTVPANIRNLIERNFAKHMMEFARSIGMDSATTSNTSGMNWDGVGPKASPADAARLLKYLHDQDNGRFLNQHASPDGGHTMSGYLGRKGVIGAKSGTLPRAGHWVGGMVFKGDNGDPYAAFWNTDSGANRAALAKALLADGRDGKHASIGQLFRGNADTAVARGVDDGEHTPARFGRGEFGTTRRVASADRGFVPETPRGEDGDNHYNPITEFLRRQEAQERGLTDTQDGQDRHTKPGRRGLEEALPHEFMPLDDRGFILPTNKAAARFAMMIKDNYEEGISLAGNRLAHHGETRAALLNQIIKAGGADLTLGDLKNIHFWGEERQELRGVIDGFIQKQGLEPTMIYKMLADSDRRLKRAEPDIFTGRARDTTLGEVFNRTQALEQQRLGVTGPEPAQKRKPDGDDETYAEAKPQAQQRSV